MNKYKRCIKSGVRTPTNSSWRQMHSRCYKEYDKDYFNYGARGIAVCERWKEYNNFVDDMGIRPDGLTLDRIDTNKNYEPENCRWTTNKEQQNNKNSNVLITINNVTKTAQQWIELSPTKKNTFWRRARVGWPMHHALGFCLGD